MTPAKMDRRVERTRAALMHAFVHVMHTSGYDTCTVEQIAEQANVGRSTFYMHYTGKEDILRDAMKRPMTVIAAIAGGDVSAEQIAPQMEHFRLHRQLNRVFFTPPVRAVRVKVLAELIQPRITKLSRALGARPVVPLAFVAMQVAEAQESLIHNWLFGHNAVTPLDAAAAMIASTRGVLGALLKVPANVPLLIPGERLQFRM
ncbi:MAG: TetR/AcrR family transcriptional regulator, partial [Alphaproteobacteria bacterium]|nr:TetR/AcrR family transcriptional regulator [Alphaproteobacteria bacterium]